MGTLEMVFRTVVSVSNIANDIFNLRGCWKYVFLYFCLFSSISWTNLFTLIHSPEKQWYLKNALHLLHFNSSFVYQLCRVNNWVPWRINLRSRFTSLYFTWCLSGVLGRSSRSYATASTVLSFDWSCIAWMEQGRRGFPSDIICLRNSYDITCLRISFWHYLPEESFWHYLPEDFLLTLPAWGILLTLSA